MMPAVGIGLSPAGWSKPDHRGVTEVYRTAEIAQSRGWVVALSEHLRRDGYVPSALALAGYLLGAYPGLRVMTAGIIVGGRTANSILNDSDVLASFANPRGGRLDIGVVPGYDRNDLPTTAFAHRYSAFDDFLGEARSITRTWKLHVGVAGGDRGLARAALADGWMPGTAVPMTHLRARLKKYRKVRPDGEVSLVRRWVPARDARQLENIELPPGSRTPRRLLIGGGPQAVREQLAPYLELGLTRLLIGPIASPTDAEWLAHDLSLIDV